MIHHWQKQGAIDAMPMQLFCHHLPSHLASVETKKATRIHPSTNTFANA